MASEFEFARAVVRIRRGARETAGTGVIVTPQHVLTCAHVIKTALGFSRNDPMPDRPTGPIRLSIDKVDTNRTLGATVIEGGWFRSLSEQELNESTPEQQSVRDLAILKLDDPLPAEATIMLFSALRETGSRFIAHGFPGGQARQSRGGILSSGQHRDFQVEWDADATPIREGFSGGPVWSNELGAMIGLTFEALIGGTDRIAFMRSSTDILRALQQAGVGARQRRCPAGLKEKIAPELLYFVDHDRQFEAFSSQIDLLSKVPEKRPVICMTSSPRRIRADYLLQRACRKFLPGKLAGMDFKEIKPQSIVWPAAIEDSPLGARTYDLLRQISDLLGLATDPGLPPTWDAVRDAIVQKSADLQAGAAIHVALEGSDLDDVGVALLTQWIDFWNAVGKSGLRWRPLLFHTVSEPIAGDGAAKWVAAFGLPAPDQRWPQIEVIRLPNWQPVGADEIRKWFRVYVGTRHKRLAEIASHLADDLLDHLRGDAAPADIYVETCADALEQLGLLQGPPS